MGPCDARLGAHRVAEGLVSRAIGFVLAVFVAPLALGTGCGENCRTSCFKAYDERECNVDTPGVPADRRISECVSECQAALRQVGPMGDYSPFSSGSLTPSSLENERQAAAWMDCIAESTCEQLQNRRCSPL